jgi:hypothetical protein
VNWFFRKTRKIRKVGRIFLFFILPLGVRTQRNGVYGGCTKKIERVASLETKWFRSVPKKSESGGWAETLKLPNQEAKGEYLTELSWISQFEKFECDYEKILSWEILCLFFWHCCFFHGQKPGKKKSPNNLKTLGSHKKKSVLV